MPEEFIERRIITGLITSTEYLLEIEKIWKGQYIESSAARIIADWCWEYYRKYKTAPGKDMEGIFLQKMKHGIPKDTAEDIQDILEGLSDEWDRGQFNSAYLLDQTRSYFQSQNLKQFAAQIQDSVETGEIAEADKLARAYQILETPQSTAIDPFSSAARIKAAFTETSEPLIHFPKALGQFWNSQLARDSFVALMGPEKRGKTFMLIELAMRAMKSGCNTVFFQAGDMTENQFLRRLCVYLARRSDRERYCGSRYIPTVDCWKNQTGTCKHSEQESPGFILFPAGMDRKEVTYEILVSAIQDNPDYQPCRNCTEIEGACFLKQEEAVKPLQWKEAYKLARKFNQAHSNRFKLATYPNETLTTQEVSNLLDSWERSEGFVPDVILIDYADIMAPDPDCSRLESRHQHTRLWQRLRRLSQERHCLVVTATQAAASSYSKETITLSDFSEDKRKFAHVTAMYGLNQTPAEKGLGILRVNELVVREDDFNPNRQIKILQCLQRGKPFIGSYF
ncbi:MAG: hypothetical protein EOM17_02010 [Synergistales bacterium]|nr:hypothetical protein [Synergistales bacterium]